MGTVKYLWGQSPKQNEDIRRAMNNPMFHIGSQYLFDRGESRHNISIIFETLALTHLVVERYSHGARRRNQRVNSRGIVLKKNESYLLSHFFTAFQICHLLQSPLPFATHEGALAEHYSSGHCKELSAWPQLDGKPQVQIKIEMISVKKID